MQQMWLSMDRPNPLMIQLLANLTHENGLKLRVLEPYARNHPWRGLSRMRNYHLQEWRLPIRDLSRMQQAVLLGVPWDYNQSWACRLERNSLPSKNLFKLLDNSSMRHIDHLKTRNDVGSNFINFEFSDLLDNHDFRLFGLYNHCCSKRSCFLLELLRDKQELLNSIL